MQFDAVLPPIRLKEIPQLAKEAERSGRKREAVNISVTALVVSEDTEREFARSQLAFYASTPTYRPVMDLHGWGEVADQLRQLSRRGQWNEMADWINDEMMETFATVAPREKMAEALQERYTGLADRITLYLPFIPGERDPFWQAMVRDMKASR
ncbi:MAG: hypothetical protein A2Z14_15745 [Chloroflexi bacterium RBG_16_48_8]|nr:MAG: hypothetical protein A2Z14_15745 [Chloroflexi bacterium RBG_16_48_8]